MTVQQEQSYITHVYSGPGDYPFHFTIHNVNNLKVTHLSEVGSPHELVLNSDYTLTFDSSNSTGVVHSVYTATSGSLDIRRVLPIEQLVDYVNNSVFNVEILERSLDYLTMITQDAMREVLIGAVSTNWRGDWVSGVDYNPKDVVVAPNNNWYTATVLHTAGDFDTDLAGGKWRLVADISVIESYKDQANTSANNAATSESNAAASESGAAASAILAQQAIADGHSIAAGNGIDITVSGSNPIVETISATNIISSDLTLYLSPTGNDTTGDGSHASPWFSINRAMDYLKDKILSAYVTIYVNDGFYNFTETQVVSHPYADKITILGSNQNLNATMVFASGGTWDICLHINNCNGLKIKNFLVGSTDYSKGIALEIDNSIVTVGAIGAQSAMEGLRCKNSYLESISGTSIVTLGQTLYGLHFISSTAVLHTVNCSDPTDNMNFGVTVEKGSALTVVTDATVYDCKDHAFQAHTSSRIMLTGTLSLGNNANDSTPVRTTGANTAPNFGNFGSFIMSV